MDTVTIIGTLPPVKGISAYNVELCKNLARHIKIEFIGFKSIYPEFLYPGGTIDKSSKEPEIKNLDNRSFLTWYNPISWVWAGISTKGKIVHGQWWSHVLAPVYITILLLARVRRKKIILTVHNVSPHENNVINNILNRSVFMFADRFIVHSKNNKKIFCRRYKIDPKKVHVIPHGVLKPARLKNYTKKQSRKFLGLKEKDKVILFFGTIRAYKGVDILIKAFKKAKIKNKKLVIAGKCWKDKEYYLKLIGNDDNIILIDRFIPTTEVEYYFRAADLVVLPYKRFESASGVGALVLSFHVPFIVSKVGGLPELVVDRKHCVFKPGNINELKDKICLIMNSRALREKLKKDSKLKEKEFSWESIVKKTLDVYDL